MKEPFFTIDERIETLCRQAEEQCAGIFRQIDDTADYNARKVLAAFIKNRVSEPMFAGTTGYGYGDIGREALDAVLADIFGCEDALIRHNFVSGTHALTTALFGVLRPGDTIVSLTGRPYDTLEEVVGLRGEGHGSLKEWGVTFRMQELAPDGHIDFDAIPAAVQGARVAYIQRSRGYTLRPSVTVAEIARVVELCAHRLTAPGVGKEVGCTLGESRNMFIGLFLAPTVVAAAVKTAVLTSAVCQNLGYAVTPRWNEKRTDIIQAITLGDEASLVAFCQGVQKGAPVDAYVTPEPWDMPGYESQVIMAAGAFTMGASIELSADAPIREPYAAWMQGALTYPSGKVGLKLALQSMLEQGALKL